MYFPRFGKSGMELTITEIELDGSTITVDETSPDKPIVRIDFDRPKRSGPHDFGYLGEEDWARLRPHLESLPELRHLRICGIPGITQPSLQHLEGLTQLEVLEIYATWIPPERSPDPGKPVTEAAVEELKKKLPNTKIVFFDPLPGLR